LIARRGTSRAAADVVPVVRIALALTLLVLLAACGEDDPARPLATPAPVTVAGRGVSVELPTGWQAAPSPLTPHLDDPREVLAVGTYPLRYRELDCAHMPTSALVDLGPTDALVTVQERGTGVAGGFPLRPARFGPELGGPSEASACAPNAHFTDHWFGFSDGQRHFHALVAFGPQVSAAVRDQAWGILDRLRVDPSVTPDWRASG
jgi:hypothetical protein